MISSTSSRFVCHAFPWRGRWRAAPDEVSNPVEQLTPDYERVYSTHLISRLRRQLPRQGKPYIRHSLSDAFINKQLYFTSNPLAASWISRGSGCSSA